MGLLCECTRVRSFQWKLIHSSVLFKSKTPENIKVDVISNFNNFLVFNQFNNLTTTKKEESFSFITGLFILTLILFSLALFLLICHGPASSAGAFCFLYIDINGWYDFKIIIYFILNIYFLIFLNIFLIKIFLHFIFKIKKNFKLKKRINSVF